MRKIYPKSIMLYFSIAFIAILLSILFFVMVFFIINLISSQDVMMWFSLASSIIGVIYLSYKLIHVMKRKILLYEDSIFISEDIGNKVIKLQYKTDVKFDQIEYIDMLISSNNSLNQSMRFVITPMPYIVLHLKNGKEEWMNMYYYSKKQTIEIINYIIEKKKKQVVDFTHKNGQELLNDLRNSNLTKH